MRCALPTPSRCCTAALCVYNVVTLYACFLVFRHLNRSGWDERESRAAPPPPALYDDSVPTAGAALSIIGRRLPHKPTRQTSHLDEQYWSQWKQSAFADKSALRNVSHGEVASAWQSATRTVEIWSTTGQGFYLWEHVLDGQLTSRLNGIWYYGEKVLGNTKFKFRGGRGILPDKVPDAAEHVVLALNGRSQSQIAAARAWLDALRTFERLNAAALLLLGDERCANDWLLNYLPPLRIAGQPPNGNDSSISGSIAIPSASAGAPLPVAAGATTPITDEVRVRLKQTFLIYDSPLVDGRLVRQWPLGVATYRGFPKRLPPDVAISGGVRQYICNFLGTVYEGSTRKTLLSSIQRYADEGLCYVKARAEWSPGETTASMAEYVSILRSSELTLCPVGLNSETYRIYEAISMGSVPVIEDAMTPGECRAATRQPVALPDFGRDSGPQVSSQPAPSPYGILKMHGAPVIFVQDWRELDSVLRRERRMTPEQRLARRKRLVLWYADFLASLKRTFVQSINTAFFNDSSLPDDPLVL